jgi:hypothetical protein
MLLFGLIAKGENAKKKSWEIRFKPLKQFITPLILIIFWADRLYSDQCRNSQRSYIIRGATRGGGSCRLSCRYRWRNC